MGPLRFSKQLINMKKYKIIATFLLGFAFLLVISVTPTLASSSLVDTSAAGYANGDYKLDYIREYAIYIAKLILGLVGSLSLLAFVAGGTMFLISAGDQEKVKKGKEIITAAVVGLLITFSSVLIINVFLGGLGLGLQDKTGVITAPSTPSKQ